MGTSFVTRLRTLWALSAERPRGAFFVNGPHGASPDPLVFGFSGVPPEGWLAGIANLGAVGIDTVSGLHYTNVGTKQAPLWDLAGLQVAPPVTLSNADLLVLHDTPVLLVPAVAGRAILPILVLLALQGNTAPYQGGGVLFLGYQQDNGSVANEFQDVPGGAITSGENSFYTLPLQALQDDIAVIAGKPLVLSNATGNYSDAPGTLTVTAAYLVL